MARTLKLFISTAFSLAALALQVASAETWYWSPTHQSPNEKGTLFYFWNDAQNWTNSAAARGFPQAGDTALIGWGSAGDGPYNVCGNSSSYALHEVRFEGNKSLGMNQGNIVLRGGGGGLKYMHNSSNGNNWMGLYAVGDGEVPIHVDKNVTYALQMRMQKQGSGNPTIVKTGPGKFVCHNQASGQSYTIPLTLIRQGAYDITTPTALNGVTLAFDGDDDSQRITYCYRATDLHDLTLKNIGFYETNGVANTTHGFSAQNDNQVKFTGTPKQNPTVFSGQFYSKSGLNWAPDSASYTFVCSNAVSATHGSVIVTKGTVKLVTGASFTALSRLDVAAGAVFDVEEGSGANFHADSMTLADATAQLKLATGVSLEIDAATLQGKALPAGTYSADGANDTRRAAWIDGAGTVTVVNGPANIDTWSGAGADNLATTDGNWESGEAPDVTAGDLLATFATGGTEAMLPAGTAAAFDGLVLDAANLGGSSFAFTAGSGATASVGASGISVPAASAETTWTMGWPITVAGGAQTWNIGTKNTMKFNAPIDGGEALTITGGGAVELNADGAHAGALTLDQGTFKVTAGNALGASSRTVNYHYDRASLTFDGNFTVGAPIDGTPLSAEGTSAGGLKVTAGSDVAFAGRIYNYTRMWVNVGAGGTATFRKGLSVGVNGMIGHLSLNGGGTFIVTNAPATMGQKTIMNDSTLDLRVAGNKLSSGNTYWTELSKSRLVTRVDNAFDNGMMVYLGTSSSFDMDGHNQKLNVLHGLAGSTVTSSRPATLTLLCSQNGMAQDNNYGGENRANPVAFAGQVNVTKQGSCQHTLAATSSSTGTLKVTAGTLTLSGSWPNCTNVVVSGGTFAVKNANAFGDADRAPGEKPKVVFNMAASGAALNLDYSGRIDCAEIHVDGEKSFGTFGAAGSGAENERSWITGTGFIRALPSGTSIIFR